MLGNYLCQHSTVNLRGFLLFMFLWPCFLVGKEGSGEGGVGKARKTETLQSYLSDESQGINRSRASETSVVIEQSSLKPEFARTIPKPRTPEASSKPASKEEP